jgi:hypothetical protein
MVAMSIPLQHTVPSTFGMGNSMVSVLEKSFAAHPVISRSHFWIYHLRENEYWMSYSSGAVVVFGDSALCIYEVKK